MNVFEYYFTAINGAPLALRNWTGQPLILVNTATHSEYTPQLMHLLQLWRDYHGAGLQIIGIPCNDFGEQEPDDEATIDQFCRTQYGIRFPLTSKQSVRGRGAHPLFMGLRDAYGEDVMPRWNFHKYLFDRRGEMIGSWPSKVEPRDPAVIRQIECNLSSWIF